MSVTLLPQSCVLEPVPIPQGVIVGCADVDSAFSRMAVIRRTLS